MGNSWKKGIILAGLIGTAILQMSWRKPHIVSVAVGSKIAEDLRAVIPFEGDLGCHLAVVCTSQCRGCRTLAERGFDLEDYEKLRLAMIMLGTASEAQAFATEFQLHHIPMWIVRSRGRSAPVVEGLYGTPTVTLMRSGVVVGSWPLMLLPPQEELIGLCAR